MFFLPLPRFNFLILYNYRQVAHSFSKALDSKEIYIYVLHLNFNAVSLGILLMRSVEFKE